VADIIGSTGQAAFPPMNSPADGSLGGGGKQTIEMHGGASTSSLATDFLPTGMTASVSKSPGSAANLQRLWWENRPAFRFATSGPV
jgi:hypothetical protein